MHELSIALGILDVAVEQAERLGTSPVLAIHLKLGPLSGVVKESLLAAYELAREGTPLENAALVIQDVPAQVCCSGCGVVRAVLSIQQLYCPDCGSPPARIDGGRELEIVALETEP